MDQETTWEEQDTFNDERIEALEMDIMRTKANLARLSQAQDHDDILFH